ncbi:MAG: FGGY family carbohydrate kinase [Paraglaciecola sp.]|uniref:FGGY-family carbohydrate kinase n=1 Tax=Paraglaciecola sp. TaxID=1920173 RepID=UPI0032972D47
MVDEITKYLLVIDIGKTHIKLHVLDGNLQSILSKQTQNVVDTKGEYPSFNVTYIWNWLIDGIKAVSEIYLISSISITTHGATAALINRHTASNDGLVFPVLDYEYQGISSCNREYAALRPGFNETFSPDLPAGLNLGRQLFWLKSMFPKDFMNVSDIMMYPQYWGWRFTGKLYSEITSLGCHTDLWSTKNGEYSSLVDTLAIRNLLPPIKPAGFDCGVLLPELVEELKLSPDCRFFNGIHDSNASFLRYRLAQETSPFTVISTGTWTILMASKTPLDNLNPNKDMLANIDAMGSPVACARFMGGREFEFICEQTGSTLEASFDENDLQKVIDLNVFVIPGFTGGSGPFGDRKGQFIGDVGQVSGIALATLYCALMIDYQLEMLGAEGSIYIEGAFLKNDLLCAVLGQLREPQQVLLSQDSTGTVKGVGYLTSRHNSECSIEVKGVNKTALGALFEYQKKWLEYAVST